MRCARELPGLAQQFLLPAQRARDDRVQIVQPGLPAELRVYAPGGRHQRRRVARAAGFFPDLERAPGADLSGRREGISSGRREGIPGALALVMPFRGNFFN